jgi:hypothetical protein
MLNRRRIFILGTTLGMIILYIILWAQMIISRPLRTGTDFIHFFAAGQVAQRWGGNMVYQPDLQQIVEQEQVGFELAPGQVLLFIHMPYLIPVLQTLVSDNYIASFYRWVAIMLMFYIASGIILTRLTPQITGRDRWLVILGLLLIYPICISIILGQDTALLVLGASLWVYGIIKNDDRAAGLGLSLTSMRPHLMLALSVPFLFKRQRILPWFALGGVVLGGISLITLGLQGTLDFIAILQRASSGNLYGLKPAAMFSLFGLIYRSIPNIDVNALRTFAWVFFGLAVLGLSWFVKKSKELGDKELGIMILVGTFTIQYLHYHDLSVLIIPILLAMRQMLNRQLLSVEKLVLIPLGIALVLLISNFAQPLSFTVPYLLMLGLGLWLWYPKKTAQLIQRFFPEELPQVKTSG